MAKRKACTDTAAESRTKKVNPLPGGKNSAKATIKTHSAADVCPPRADDLTEEPMERKVKQEPRISNKKRASSSSTPPTRAPSTPARTRAHLTRAPSTPARTRAPTTSKYFTSPLREEPQTECRGDFDVVAMSTPAGKAGLKEVEKEVEEKMVDEEDSDNEEDWEDVEELPELPAVTGLPGDPVQIEIETPELIRQRKKKEKSKVELETYLRRMVNRYNKDVLIDTHKVHLLCLIANGIFRNRLCSEPDLLAIMLSLVPTHFTMVAKLRIDERYLSGLLKWFAATFTLNPGLHCGEGSDPRALLERRLASLSARDHQEMTHLFLLVLRSLQLFSRLVLSLQPLSLKPPPAKGKGRATASPGTTEAPPAPTAPPQPKTSPGRKRPEAGNRSREGGGGGKRARKEEVKKEHEELKEEGERGEGDVPVGRQRPKNAKRRSVASKVSYKEPSDSEEEPGAEPSEGEEFQLSGDSEDSGGGAKSRRNKEGKGKGTAQKTNQSDIAQTKRRGGAGKQGARNRDEEEEDEEEEEEEDEWEEEEEGGGKAASQQGVKRRSGGRSRGEKERVAEWLEVYLERTERWVSLDVLRGVAPALPSSQHAPGRPCYVVSLDSLGRLRDLGRRYDPGRPAGPRGGRVDQDWWEETLGPLVGPRDHRDTLEDQELQAKLLDRPLPTSIVEYKNHPLYALKRHLLKYEALYPPTVAVLGYCRGEPVYSRDCVHTLHSRDTWLKAARTVRLGEEPYKMVRGFSNRSRKARMMSEQKEVNDLPLFGEWQTEAYQPPVAVDGKVPRNEYGNVYLFKSCMLPLGCVHVRLASLNRVARKLGMDAAPAVTGFDFHGGYSHAVTDGYVVCEEHEQILREAWVEEQEIQKQKEKEKREKRATSNWTLLVKGLLIRERLKLRYGKKAPGPGGAGASSHTHAQGGEGGGGLSSDEEGGEGGACGTRTAAETLAMSWPQNRQEEKEEEEERKGSAVLRKTSRRDRRGQEKNLFPFEKV